MRISKFLLILFILAATLTSKAESQCLKRSWIRKGTNYGAIYVVPGQDFNIASLYCVTSVEFISSVASFPREHFVGLVDTEDGSVLALRWNIDKKFLILLSMVNGRGIAAWYSAPLVVLRDILLNEDLQKRTPYKAVRINASSSDIKTLLQ